MPYSLTSATTLGFDLVRRPAGWRVADVLLTAVAADPDLLQRLANAHPDSRPTYAVTTRRTRELAATVPRLGLPPAAGDLAGASPRGLLTYLTESTVGTAAAVERLVRVDILATEHPGAAVTDEPVLSRAADVLSDAAVGAWASDVLPADLRHQLSAPFDAVTAAAQPRQLDLGPATEQLKDVLTSVASTQDEHRHRWRQAVDASRARRRPWADAMHNACWAAHLSGRTRAVAGAHLLAVMAFRQGKLNEADAGYGVWNALSGCVQGLALADILDDTTLGTLSAPWEHATGGQLFCLAQRPAATGEP